MLTRHIPSAVLALLVIAPGFVANWLVDRNLRAQDTPAPKSDSPAPLPDHDGFRPLFNGRDLTGWEAKAGKPDSWTVREGVLICQGGGSGWLGTTDEFADFVLKLEWRLPINGNSGVFVRAPAQGDPAFAGMEIQVLDDNGPTYAGKLKNWQLCGSIYGAVPPAKSAYKPGDWNAYTITCQGSRVTVVHNGQTVVDADTAKPPYTDKLYGHAPLAGRPRRGFIGLQNHGSGVEYRHIAIKVLDAPAEK